MIHVDKFKVNFTEEQLKRGEELLPQARLLMGAPDRLTAEVHDGEQLCTYRLTRRGSKGVTSIKLREGDQVVSAIQIEANSEKEIILTSVQGLMVRLRCADFKLCGRATYGTIVMRLNENDKVAFAALMDELSEEEIAANKQKAIEEAEMAAVEAEFQAKQEEAQRSMESDDDEDDEDAEGVENTQEEGENTTSNIHSL